MHPTDQQPTQKTPIKDGMEYQWTCCEKNVNLVKTSQRMLTFMYTNFHVLSGGSEDKSNAILAEFSLHTFNMKYFICSSIKDMYFKKKYRSNQ